MSSVAVKQPTGLTAWLANDAAKERIADMVGDIMPPGQFISHMLTAFQDDKIQKCDDRSKFEAVHKCAALGLLPTLDQVRLIPYGNKCTVMPQWQGYKALMERHPAILEVSAHLVHVSDSFAFVDGYAKHEYDPFDAKRTIKGLPDIRGGYCVIQYRDGRPPKYHFTPVAHITKARACAKTTNIWDAWFEQMALKTCYRDCYARRAVPIDPLVQQRLASATAADDAVLCNDPRRIGGKRRQTVPLAELTGDLIDQQVDDSHDGIDEPADLLGGNEGPGPAVHQRDEYMNEIGTLETVGQCESMKAQAEGDPLLTPDTLRTVLDELARRMRVIKATEKK
jgi:phage RecT family recombinase